MNAVMPTYGHPTVSFEKGEGAYLFDTGGRRYLDFAAGIAVNSLGHSHPHLVAALTEQAGRLWHVSNLYNIPDQVRLAERLCGMSFADAVFFCNSGTEAMEGSVKAARRYHAVNGNPERWRSITLENSFHGRTLAMLSASKNPKHLDGFGDPADGFDVVPMHNMDALRDAITPETGAILVEPIQGEGGLRPLKDGYLKELRSAADEFGLLLVFDEVQTGFGRTGRLFSHEWSGVSPDIMGCAKGIAGGFPCGAILASQAVADTMTAGTHGSTFGGNPLAMAVANATLDILTGNGFLEAVQESGAKLMAGLKELTVKYDTVLEGVRGKGLMLGLIVKAPHTNAALGEAAREHDLLTVVAGENVLRMLPPLVIGETEIAEALAAMDKACASLASAAHD
ncbi:MAG: aspartate aminotransferase family protein [Alphaproteobacteria bacterium]|nr:aspartate aminotransferase family protein [Alphaproteobacteria bacterium]